jgi:hypothetical protein
MIHNRTATVVALARQIRAGLDEKQVETKIVTPTLALLLDSLIELGSPQQNDRVTENRQREVRSLIATFEAMTEHG